MKKNLFIIILLILFGFSTITVKANYKCENTDLIHSDILCKKETSKNTLVPIINDNKCALTNVIDLTFSLETTDFSTISSIDYNLDGFEFNQTPIVENNDIMIKLLVDETSDVHTVTITAHLSDFSTLTSKIYGYINDDYIYLSGCSFEAARDIYLTEALTNSIITQKEYEDIINDRFECNETISNTQRISTQSNTPFPYNFFIEGNLQWQDDSGNVHPLQYIYVELDCIYKSKENPLTTTYTDQNGYYSFNISSSSDNLTTDNLYIKVMPVGTNVTVNTGTGGDYIWRSSSYDSIISGDNVTINRTFNMRNTDDIIDGVAGDGDLGRALQISQALIYADKFATTMNGSSLAKIRARYPVSDKTQYNYLFNRIDLRGIESDYDYADWDVIFHEYGHHIQHILGNINILGCHHSSDTDLSLTYGIDGGTMLAWHEAWPTIFGEIAQQYYSEYLSNIAGVADGGYTDSGNRIYSYPSPSFKYNDISNVLYNNEAFEKAIMGVLYDLYDNDSNESHDKVSLGARGWWAATVNSDITNFMNFFDIYYSSLSYEAYKNNVCKIVQYYGMPATLYDYTTNGTIVSAKYKLVGNCSIPNKIFNYTIYSIGEGAFENQTFLTSVEMNDSNITNIGLNAFSGCTSLESVTIPSSVEYIADEAFKNCSSLTLVTVNKTTKDITSLGESVFDGCNTNLQIVVPTNRVADYKNKENWSNYRNKIVPSTDYTEFEIDCEGNITDSLSLNANNNKLYKLIVNCSKSYKITTNSTNSVNIVIYDSNMDVVNSGNSTITQFLGWGTYYISIEFDSINDSGIIEIEISLTWVSANISLNSGNNNIKNSMHLNSENVYHCSYEYFHDQGEGFFKFALNAGNNKTYPEGSLKIYSTIDRTRILNRYIPTEITKQAISQSDENELYVYLPVNGYYYIDVTLPKSTYSLITLTIEKAERKDVNYINRLDGICIDELFENKNGISYFKEVTISHRSTIELDIQTSGTVNTNIPIYLFAKQYEQGSRPGDDSYYIKTVLIDNITSTNRSLVLTITLNSGTYYFGYSDNSNKVNMQFALIRRVNIDLNIEGTLVTDPARNQQFPLGTEVIFNDGALLGNTITEGFTRNIYLMVEDRLHDPMSRLDYDWYSSNENAAIVTKYGTVLALNVSENTAVTIYAVNKNDPTIVYKKDFVILKETKTEQIVIESNMSYSYSEENGMYTLELDFANSPYPYIGYYTWDIECFNGIIVDMEHFGLVSSTGIGEALLTASYTLNTRITLKIHLTITE